MSWMIKLYGMHTREIERFAPERLKGMMPQRYARSLKYRRKEDQLLCLGAGILLHQVFGIDEAELQYGPYGKPYVQGGAEFNISHGGQWVIAAMDSQPLGVDIEPICLDNLTVAQRVFTQAENAFVQQAPLLHFHILWTMKESIMKALGLGMQLDPLQFHVLPLGGPNVVCGKKWFTKWITHDGCVIACASEKQIEELEFQKVIYEEDAYE